MLWNPWPALAKEVSLFPPAAAAKPPPKALPNVFDASPSLPKAEAPLERPPTPKADGVEDLEAPKGACDPEGLAKDDRTPPALRKGDGWLANPASPELLKAEADVVAVFLSFSEAAGLIASTGLFACDSALLEFVMASPCDPADS